MTNPMTPTEQDKELDEILELLHNSWFEDDYDPTDPDALEAKQAIMQLITADRKRVALEARIDELEDLSPGMYYFGDIVKIDNRIAELKAQQEKA